MGKDGRCVELTTLPPSCADCLEILGALRVRNGIPFTTSPQATFAAPIP
jgi:hypothetical protein